MRDEIRALICALLTTVFTFDVGARCMSVDNYNKLAAKWIAVSQKGDLASERDWPPTGKYVMFYFQQGRGGSTKEMERFRIGYIPEGSCGAVNSGQGIIMLFPPFNPTVYEPSHWMPLTFVPK